MMTSHNNEDYARITNLDKKLQDKDIHEKNIEYQLTTKRIEVFGNVVKYSIGAVVLFSLLLMGVIDRYLQYFTEGTVPDNFWHIPLMLCFLISTILGLLLTSAVKFGNTTKKDETDNNSLKENIPLIKDIISLTKPDNK